MKWSECHTSHTIIIKIIDENCVVYWSPVAAVSYSIGMLPFLFPSIKLFDKYSKRDPNLNNNKKKSHILLYYAMYVDWYMVELRDARQEWSKPTFFLVEAFYKEDIIEFFLIQ